MSGLFGEVDLRRIVGFGLENPCESELPVETDGASNLLEALLNALPIVTAAADAVKQRARGQVQIVGTDTLGSPQHDAALLFFLSTKSDSQGRGHGPGDVFLYAEDVIDFPIVRVGSVNPSCASINVMGTSSPALRALRSALSLSS